MGLPPSQLIWEVPSGAFGWKTRTFRKLKTAAAISGEQYADGVYMWSGNVRRVDLLHTDLDASDFFLPNGAFRNETYELHSLITDNRIKGDAAPYMTAASVRPPSESEGKGELEILGRVLSNLPSATRGYVTRPQLELEVNAALMNDRHPVVTLVGRGGIGKTSTALEILHKITLTDRYEVIIWFSARDIDLLMSGAKSVQPHLLTDQDIAEEYQKLIGGSSENEAGKVNPIELLARDMHHNSLGPTLYVFDNFETVRNPIDLFQWIDMNIRIPNKAVITTRFRDFKADYPIEVPGMEYNEAKLLVSQTSTFLGIDKLVTEEKCKQLVEEANGHPYVMKILLGEIADKKSFTKPSKIIARREDILDALFERTYANLSPIAVRILLTLSRWRSLIPQLAVEAVLLRHSDQDVNPQLGIDQLIRMSLIERITAADGFDFLEVPLATALFCRRKLEISPYSTIIEDDVFFLEPDPLLSDNSEM